MPKKTKKEKLLAQKRRMAGPAVQSVPAPTRSYPISDTSPAGYTLSLAPASKSAAADNHDFGVIKQDIAKTLFITVSVLVAEFLLARYL